MSYDYEQSIWGRGMAVTNPTHPTAIRLRRALSAISLLPAQATVLEFGCGAGQFIRAVARERQDLQAYGTDISKSAIEEAKQADGGIQYSVSSVDATEYADNFFDAVLIFDVLEHVEDPKKILKEVGRILKPGGILYAFVPCEGDGTSQWNFLDKLHLKRNVTKRFAGHIQYFSRKQLLTLVTGAGFRIDTVRYSEHVFGQLAGIVAFVLMARASAKHGGAQVNNEEVFGGSKGKWFRFLSRFVNFAIFAESVLLCRIPSPNVHIVAKKI